MSSPPAGGRKALGGGISSRNRWERGRSSARPVPTRSGRPWRRPSARHRRSARRRRLPPRTTWGPPARSRSGSSPRFPGKGLPAPAPERELSARMIIARIGNRRPIERMVRSPSDNDPDPGEKPRRHAWGPLSLHDTRTIRANQASDNRLEFFLLTWLRFGET